MCFSLNIVMHHWLNFSFSSKIIVSYSKFYISSLDLFKATDIFSYWHPEIMCKYPSLFEKVMATQSSIHILNCYAVFQSKCLSYDIYQWYLSEECRGFTQSPILYIWSWVVGMRMSYCSLKHKYLLCTLVLHTDYLLTIK